MSLKLLLSQSLKLSTKSHTQQIPITSSLSEDYLALLTLNQKKLLALALLLMLNEPTTRMIIHKFTYLSLVEVVAAFATYLYVP